MTNTLATAEAALRKRLDLSGAQITRTDKVLATLVANKRRHRLFGVPQTARGIK